MMLKRGDALMHGIIWEQIHWEMEMKTYIQENEEMLIKPLEAYITFTNEEGFQ